MRRKLLTAVDHAASSDVPIAQPRSCAPLDLICDIFPLVKLDVDCALYPGFTVVQTEVFGLGMYC